MCNFGKYGKEISAFEWWQRQNEFLIGHPKQNGLLKYLKDWQILAF